MFKFLIVVIGNKRPLPKLPVPELSSTLDKYLRCIMPIVSDDDYERTKAIVDKFGEEGGVGQRLQAILEQQASEKENWAYDWWLDDMYLLNKAPLPINSNPAMVFPKETLRGEYGHLRFAARLISGIMDYKLVIDG